MPITRGQSHRQNERNAQHDCVICSYPLVHETCNGFKLHVANLCECGNSMHSDCALMFMRIQESELKPIACPHCRAPISDENMDFEEAEKNHREKFKDPEMKRELNIFSEYFWQDCGRASGFDKVFDAIPGLAAFWNAAHLDLCNRIGTDNNYDTDSSDSDIDPTNSDTDSSDSDI